MFADPLLSTCIKMWSQKKHVGLPKHVGGGGGLVAKSCLILATLRTIAHQVPLSVGFPKQAYWSELPFSSPEDLPDTGIKPGSPAWQVDSFPGGGTRQAHGHVICGFTLSKMTGLYFFFLIHNVGIFRCFLD